MKWSRIAALVAVAAICAALSTALLREGFTNHALAYPSKDYNTEKALPDAFGWMAQPTSCFSCEADMLQRHPDNPEMVYRSSRTRCFSCESA